MWIDALSINQDNDLEKSRQVRAMGKIYSSAQAVFCWLGWDNIDDYLDLFHHNLKEQTMLFLTKRKARVIQRQLHAMGQSEYFRRMWVETPQDTYGTCSNNLLDRARICACAKFVLVGRQRENALDYNRAHAEHENVSWRHSTRMP
jgi:hypothetical protein